ncbi:MAG TPA: hypothetical protein VJH03_08425 [Blastocatellia bacterium]|nr:hypothetical protein [Blastocatellia bacterium]
MASSYGASPGSADLKRAEELKRMLTELATAGALQEEYERQRKLFFEVSDEPDESESQIILDWFLFDWFDERGEGALNHFLEGHQDLDDDQVRIVSEWQDSINSVFELKSIRNNSLVLREMDSGDSFAVRTLLPLGETPFKRGQYITARLLPLGDGFVFSGLQLILPDREAATEALEMRRAIDNLNSPEALEEAQREQCSAFCDLFGCSELTVKSSNLTSTINRFQNYLLNERPDAETGLTPAERFKSEFGRDLMLPELPSPPAQILGASDVTILCDEFEGIVLLPDYKKFRRVFETHDPDKAVPEWRDLVWRYIKDPDISILAFERVAETHPRRVEKVLRTLLDDKTFSIEHLYAVLLHYKDPVEELSDLKDDQRLWDLLNGTLEAAPTKKRPRSKPKKSAKPVKRAQQSKTNLTGRKRGSAKPAPKRPAASRALTRHLKTAAAIAKPTAKTSRARKR